MPIFFKVSSLCPSFPFNLRFMLSTINTKQILVYTQFSNIYKFKDIYACMYIYNFRLSKMSVFLWIRNWQGREIPDFRLLQLRDVSVQAGVTAIQRREATRCHILVRFTVKESEPRKMHALLQSGSLNHQRMGNWDPESRCHGTWGPTAVREWET